MPDHGGGIPKTIKVGEQEITVADHPELLALVEAGRKSEKDKLYSQIGTLNAEIQTLKDSNKSNKEMSEADKKELKKLQDQLAVANAEVEKLKPSGAPSNPPAGKKDGEDEPKGLTQAEVDKQVKEALALQKKDFDDKFAELIGNFTKKTVADYRKEQLKKYDGLIIEALVPEDLKTEEEVNASVQKAMETSKQYIRKDYKDAEGKVSQKTLAEIEELEKPTPPAGTPPASSYVPPAGSPPPPPPSGGGSLDGKALVKNLKDMSQSEFEKNREALQQEIRKIGPETTTS